MKANAMSQMEWLAENDFELWQTLSVEYGL
jgi:hypothetical protein